MRLNIISISFLAVTSAFFFFVSCDKTRLFEQNTEIKNNLWDFKDPLVFSVNISDTITEHNFYINVRNAGFYGFSNLFLFINTTLPGGEVQRDTVECILAAPDGRWLGDGLGDIWDNRILFKEKMRFPASGQYRFELAHAMRINPLPGIMDAGIRIEKSKK